jgi:hypothetical protein
MTAALLAVLAMIVIGLPVTLALDRAARGLTLLGLAILYGSGSIWLVMLAESVLDAAEGGGATASLHIAWTPISVTIGALAVATIAAVIARRTQDAGHRTQDAGHRTPTPSLLDLATITTLAGYAHFATIAPLWDWDFWAIWGLKARVFFDHRGIDWHFLESRWNAFTHPDYPLLVPLNFDFVAILGGGWSDRWLGVVVVAWAAALLLIVRGLAAEETSPLFASAIAFAVASLSVSRFVGLAEGALIAFAGAAVLMLRRALLRDDDASWRHGAILLGLAANCKNEGLALIGSVIVAMILAGAWRKLARLWPAAALVAPWLLLRATHTLATDIAEGSVVQRLLYRLHYAPQILRFLAERLNERWFWIALLAGIVIVPQALRARERFVLFVTAIQLAVYVAAYFATPHDARWHIVTSWSRLTGQLAVPITFSVLLMLAQTVLPGDDAAHAEARLDER